MARFQYDDSHDNLSSVAQSCRYLSAATKAKGVNATDGITCSICSNWDGNSCTRRAFDNVLSELGLD